MKAKKTAKMPMMKGKMPKSNMKEEMAEYKMPKAKKTAKKGKK
jgi:hypothetical protein